MQPKNEYPYVIIDTEEKRKAFEPRQPTDEFYFGSRSGWCPVVMIDEKFNPNEIYRRRILPAPVEQSPWRLIGDLTGLTVDGNVLMSDPESRLVEVASVKRFKAKQILSNYTHWQPIAPVPRPIKPMTEEEALNNVLRHITDGPYKSGTINGWLAHIEFIKKGGGK